MSNLNYWKQFESTGKIEDYLSYRSCFDHGENSDGRNVARAMGQPELGENSYAGIHKCNGNDTEANAYRGI